MTESEFWWKLRIRIMTGVPGSSEMPLGWCDWIEPKKYILNGDAPRITGRVGFLPGSNRVTEFAFTLFLGRPVESCDEIEWGMLIPADDAGGWLTFDGSHLVIRQPT